MLLASQTTDVPTLIAFASILIFVLSLIHGAITKHIASGLKTIDGGQSIAGWMQLFVALQIAICACICLGIGAGHQPPSDWLIIAALSHTIFAAVLAGGCYAYVETKRGTARSVWWTYVACFMLGLAGSQLSLEGYFGDFPWSTFGFFLSPVFAIWFFTLVASRFLPLRNE